MSRVSKKLLKTELLEPLIFLDFSIRLCYDFRMKNVFVRIFLTCDTPID